MTKTEPEEESNEIMRLIYRREGPYIIWLRAIILNLLKDKRLSQYTVKVRHS